MPKFESNFRTKTNRTRLENTSNYSERFVENSKNSNDPKSAGKASPAPPIRVVLVGGPTLRPQRETGMASRPFPTSDPLVCCPSLFGEGCSAVRVGGFLQGRQRDRNVEKFTVAFGI